MIVVLPAVGADAGELLTVQLGAFVTEARALGEADIPPLRDTLAEVRAAIAAGTVLVARDVPDLSDGPDPPDPAAPVVQPGRLVGAVRLADHGGSGYLGRLAVVPDRRGEGIAGRLIDALLVAAAGRFTHVDLVTARRSGHNVAMYTRRGWSELPTGPGTGRTAMDDVGIELVAMRRPVEAPVLAVRDLASGPDAAVVARLWTAATLARLRGGDLGAGTDPGALADAGRTVTTRAGTFGVVVDLAGRPVAVAVAAPARTADGRGLDRVPGLAHVSAVCSDPVRWGAGAGSAAVRGVLAAAAARGFDRVQLAVDADNPRARTLYARLGFVPEPGWTAVSRSGSTLERWSRSVDPS